MKPGGCAAVAAGAGSGDGQRCAAAGGDAERTAARRGGADHGRALYQRFRSASGAAWHGARVKKAPETGLYTSMRVMASQVVLLVVRHAKFVRFYHCRPPYD